MPRRSDAAGIDLLGDGFTLLRVGSNGPAGDALVAAAGDRGVPLEVLDVADDAIGDLWDRVPLILVRPDGHVAWRSGSEPTEAQAAEVIDRVTGHGGAHRPGFGPERLLPGN